MPALLLALAACSSLSAAEPPAPTAATTAGLERFLEQSRRDASVPALSVAVADADGIVFAHATGQREIGGSDEVSTGDRFHVGSVSKPITATMIARLVEKGLIDWRTTPADVWPEQSRDMHPGLRRITVEQLLSHRAGLPSFETDEENATFPLRGESPRQERKRFAEWVLAKAPAFPVGEHVYSNAGYGVVAAMAEQVGGNSWEELVQSEVFGPLGMTSCGFGWPSTIGNEPAGHRSIDGRVVAHDLADGYRLSAAIAPAGDIHCSMPDLARFGQAHLRGLNGETGYLDAATFQKLHEAPEGEYALGWNVRAFGSHHLGSAGTFTANLIVFGDSRIVTALAGNAASLSAQQVSAIMSRLHREFGPPPATAEPPAIPQ